MKKFLLSLAAFAATMGLSAQTGSWNATFSPVENAEDMGAVHVAQAGDGSVYASSIYSQAFTFGKTSVAAPEISGSSVIVKYNEKGEAQWAVSLHGAASVTALTADADGTLYAAGAYQDEVFIKDAKGTESTLAEGGMGFILKVSADGSVAVQKTFASAPNEEIEASFVYFPDDGDIYCASASKMFGVPVEKHGFYHVFRNPLCGERDYVPSCSCAASESGRCWDYGDGSLFCRESRRGTFCRPAQREISEDPGNQQLSEQRGIYDCSPDAGTRSASSCCGALYGGYELPL